METPYSETQNSASNPGEGSVVSGMNLNCSGRQVLLDMTNDSPISCLLLDRGDVTETPVSYSYAGEGSVVSGMNLNCSGRQVLLDMTNDSPISCLLLDRGDVTETPVSNTKPPGTGEALLRYKVKSLMQRVESNCIKPASSLRTPQCHLNGYQPSPSRLLAPTPANTPESTVAPNSFTSANNSPLSKKSDQTIGAYEDLGMSSPGPESKVESSVYLSDTPHPEVIDAVDLTENMCSPEIPTTRALLFDSTISSPSSVVSEWSVQVNISSPCPEQQAVDYAQENKVEDQADDYETKNSEDGDEYEAIGDEECEELCQGLNKVSVHDNGGLPPFAGRHTRFVYNSDDELEREEEVPVLPSPSLLHLRGMPTPKGKHLRFSEEDNDSENISN